MQVGAALLVEAALGADWVGGSNDVLVMSERGFWRAIMREEMRATMIINESENIIGVDR